MFTWAGGDSNRIRFEKKHKSLGRLFEEEVELHEAKEKQWNTAFMTKKTAVEEQVAWEIENSI